MAAEFGGRHIAQKEGVWSETIRRTGAELVLPERDGFSAAHLTGNAAQRRNGIAFRAAIGPPRAVVIFEIDAPDFRERKIAPITNHRPCLRPECRTGRGRSDALRR